MKQLKQIQVFPGYLFSFLDCVNKTSLKTFDFCFFDLEKQFAHYKYKITLKYSF